MKSVYFSRLRRNCGVDEKGAERLERETPYCLADFAYADPRFVHDWCQRLNIPYNMPPKRIVDAEEMARIEQILQKARRDNRNNALKRNWKKE